GVSIHRPEIAYTIHAQAHGPVAVTIEHFDIQETGVVLPGHNLELDPRLGSFLEDPHRFGVVVVIKILEPQAFVSVRRRRYDVNRRPLRPVDIPIRYPRILRDIVEIVRYIT